MVAGPAGVLLLVATLQVPPAAAVRGGCNESAFPHSLNDTQCYHGGKHVGANDAAGCAAACCESEGCPFWNFADGSHRKGLVNGCWIGVASSPPPRCVAGRLGWVGGSRASPPPEPAGPPPGPPPVPAGVAIRLDQSKPELSFDGLGAIIDASSRLMYDYPEPQRSEILDFLFRKNFGAGLTIAKVEVGGDSQQTDGTTASYRHNSATEVPNWNRSHIWWAMHGAKQRRSDVVFYGLGWGFPGWLPSFYSNATAQYLADWVAGAKQAHGFDVKVLGLWNERQPCTQPDPESKAWNCDVIFALRDALDARGHQNTLIAGVDHQASALAGVVETNAPIGLVATHGPPDLDPEMATYFRGRGLHFWRSEGEETYSSSGMLAHRLVRDFVEYGAQASIEWPIVQGFYPTLPWGEHDMFFGAHSPWSGFYSVPSSVWVFAHLGQFAEPKSWRYLGGEGGKGFLSGGGAFASLISEGGTELTLLIETLAGPNCTKDSQGRTISNCPTESQVATFVLPPTVRQRRHDAAASADGTPHLAFAPVEVWESDLSSNDPAHYMIKRPPLKVDMNGSFTLGVPLNRLLTVTTRVGTAQKGQHPPPPPLAAFPLPYTAEYSTMQPMSRPGPYLNDQQGSFEIATVGRLTGLLQSVRQEPVNWVHATPRPLTLFGDAQWDNITVSTTAYILEESQIQDTTIFNCSMQREFEPGGALGVTKLPAPQGGTFVAVGARVITGGNICNAGALDRQGYFFSVHANRTYSVTKGAQHVLAHGELPALEVLALGGPTSLVGTKLEVAITVVGTTIIGQLNGVKIVTVGDTAVGCNPQAPLDCAYATGFASLVSGWHQAMFTSVSVRPA